MRAAWGWGTLLVVCGACSTPAEDTARAAVDREALRFELASTPLDAPIVGANDGDYLTNMADDGAQVFALVSTFDGRSCGVITAGTFHPLRAATDDLFLAGGPGFLADVSGADPGFSTVQFLDGTCAPTLKVSLADGGTVGGITGFDDGVAVVQFANSSFHHVFVSRDGGVTNFNNQQLGVSISQARLGDALVVTNDLGVLGALVVELWVYDAHTGAVRQQNTFGRASGGTAQVFAHPTGAVMALPQDLNVGLRRMDGVGVLVDAADWLMPNTGAQFIVGPKLHIVQRPDMLRSFNLSDAGISPLEPFLPGVDGGAAFSNLLTNVTPTPLPPTYLMVNTSLTWSIPVTSDVQPLGPLAPLYPRVNSQPVGTVSRLTDGGVLAMWLDTRGDVRSVWGRTFDAQLNPVGPSAQVAALLVSSPPVRFAPLFSGGLALTEFDEVTPFVVTASGDCVSQGRQGFGAPLSLQAIGGESTAWGYGWLNAPDGGSTVWTFVELGADGSTLQRWASPYPNADFGLDVQGAGELRAFAFIPVGGGPSDLFLTRGSDAPALAMRVPGLLAGVTRSDVWWQWDDGGFGVAPLDGGPMVPVPLRRSAGALAPDFPTTRAVAFEDRLYVNAAAGTPVWMTLDRDAGVSIEPDVRGGPFTVLGPDLFVALDIDLNDAGISRGRLTLFSRSDAGTIDAGPGDGGAPDAGSNIDGGPSQPDGGPPQLPRFEQVACGCSGAPGIFALLALGFLLRAAVSASR